MRFDKRDFAQLVRVAKQMDRTPASLVAYLIAQWLHREQLHEDNPGSDPDFVKKRDKESHR